MATSTETATETSIPNDIDNAKAPNRNADAATILSGDSIESNEAAQNSADAETLKDSIHLSEMESSLESNNFPIDEIPEPIKVLDEIISEFEETSKPVLVANTENQSEDDGYMSLSRKNMRKTDSEEASLTSLNRASVETPPNQEFISKTNGEINSSDENVKNEPTITQTEQSLIQTTLPKARSTSTNATQSNYSSLPCCGGRSSSFTSGEIGHKQHRIGSCNGDRNVLGIDISAVHKAVLRGGVPKLPEPILNEHPVTIYPGRYSPPNGDGLRGSGIATRPHRLLTSVEKHKEVCHILKPQSSKSSSSSSSPHSTSGSLASKSQESNTDVSNNKKLGNMKKKLAKNELRTNYDESDDDVDDAEGDDFSEDSIDGEQSSLSMSAELLEKPITARKQASIAWEINFNSERRRSKPQFSARSASRKHQKKVPSSTAFGKPKEKSFGIAYSNAIYSLDPDEEFANNVYAVEDFRNYNENLDYYTQQPNMLGKGTFVIRRSTPSKQLPRAADVFQVSATNHASDLPNACLSSPSPPLHRECYRIDDSKLKCSSSQHGSMDRCHNQRSSLPSPRERLSLNIEGHTTQHNSLKKDADLKNMTSSSLKKIPSEELNKLSKASLKQTDRQNSIELIIENDNCSGDYEGINAFSAYRCPNGSSSLKSSEYSSGKSLDIHPTSATTTPHTDLAPTIEEDEEQYSDLSYSGATAAPTSGPRLKQIESNISALLRGEIAVARAGDVAPPIRSLEFRPGVHKSESAKEMLLSQNTVFGPLPPSPPPTDSSSKPSLYDYDALPLPPLPPSPTAASTEGDDDDEPHMQKGAFLLRTTSVEVHKPNNAELEERVCHSRDRSADRREHEWERERKRGTVRQMSDDLPLLPTASNFEHMPPAVPPHRGHSANTMKSWSIDSNYRRRSPKVIGGSMGAYGGCGGSGITTPTGTQHGTNSSDMLGFVAGGGGGYSTKRYYGTKRSCKQSPREEHRGSLQTSCSLPETPIFARGCDIPRTPFRRSNENNPVPSGSRTAPRSTSHSINMGASIVGIGATGGVTSMCRNRSISHALASNEMLRMSGVPARGWYPKQRSMRPASTENIDRLTSMRVWDCAATNIGSNGTSSRKPLTLPPNLTPSFLNKSPREALRRVTSLLITKKKNTKERKARPYYEDTVDGPIAYEVGTCTSTKDMKHDLNCNSSALPKAPKPPKKKGLFKNLWKRTKHFSLDQ